MLWDLMPLLRIMNPGVCTVFADYFKFCAKVDGQGVILTFDTSVASFTHLVDCKYKIKVHRQQKFPKNEQLPLFLHTKAYVTKSDLDVNWFKVKPVIIWKNYDGPQDHNTTYHISTQSVHWFRRRFFFTWLPYTVMADGFVMWPNSYLLIFISLFLKAFLWNLVTNGPVVLRKKVLIFISEWPWAKIKDDIWPWILMYFHLLI